MEYVLVAVVVSVAALMVLGPGSLFFQKIGQVFRIIGSHVSLAGNWLVAEGP